MSTEPISKEVGVQTTIPISSIETVMNIRTNASVDVTELMHSIRKMGGLLEPIKVWRHPSIDGRYMMDFGHRRLLALKKCGWTELTIGRDVIVHDEPYTNKQHILELIEENRQRVVNSPEELGNMVRRLRDDEGMGPAEIAEVLMLSINRVKSILGIIDKIPPKHLKNVGVYRTSRRYGKVPQTLISKIYTPKFLFDDEKDELVEMTRKNGLTGDQIGIIIDLMRRDKELSLEQAAKMVNQYEFHSPRFTMRRKVLQSLYERYGTDKHGLGKIMMDAMMGKIALPHDLFFS